MTTSREAAGPFGEPVADSAVRAVGEFVGTFALVFIGVGAALSIGLTAEEALLVVALAHAFVYGAMVTATGHISGGHFNPAVTIGFLITRRIPIALGVLYVIAQMAAATAAAGVLRWLWPGGTAEAAGYGAPAIDPGLKTGEALVLEALVTFFLVWVFFALAADIRGAYKATAGLAIGLVYGAAILVAGPLTGGSTGAVANPARVFGPQLMDSSWDDFWIWYAGPILGGAIAALLYELLFLRPLRPATALSFAGEDLVSDDELLVDEPEVLAGPATVEDLAVADEPPTSGEPPERAPPG